MQNTATITICVWKLKLMRMETLPADKQINYRFFQGFYFASVKFKMKYIS